MKSGLEGRNNGLKEGLINGEGPSLNEVRPRRPEQLEVERKYKNLAMVSMKSGLEGRNNTPGRTQPHEGTAHVSMKSGLEGRNNS